MVTAKSLNQQRNLIMSMKKTIANIVREHKKRLISKKYQKNLVEQKENG